MPEFPRLFQDTCALVDIDSTTGREGEIGEFLFLLLARLAQQDGHVERMPVEGDRFNVFASWGEPTVVLTTHMDAVPPFFPSSQTADAIRGRGACDAKGIAAAMISAVEALLAQGHSGFGLLFVVAEETDSLGARVANDNPRGSRYLINGEPTENRLVLGHNGTLFYEVHATGRASHSAYPERGCSAIDALLAALERLRHVPLPSDPLLGPTTFNIGTIAGGRAPNVIADNARAEILVRTVGDTEALDAAIRAALTGASEPNGAKVAIVRHGEAPPARMGSLPGFETDVVRFGTDVPRLRNWGEPFLLGPGSIHVAHTADEWIAKSDLVRAVELYQRMVIELLSRG